MNLVFHKFTDKLPDVPHRSSSYGGQYYSDWIMVISPNGSVDVHQFTVGKSIHNNDPVTEEEKWLLGHLRQSCWSRFHHNSVWAYTKDIQKQFDVTDD